MSIGTIAFVPAAPLLIPAVAGGSAGHDEELRAASREVVRRALAIRPDGVAVVAGVPISGRWDAAATWDFAGFGVVRTPPDPRPALPWPLGIGAWLLDECGWRGPRQYLGVDLPAPASADADRSGDRKIAVVVVGDGSARRSERAPGHFDKRAEPFDRAVAALLGAGDAAGFAELDPELAAALMCGGLLAWQWTAAALSGATVTSAELLTHVAPYGVGYFVALWSIG
jgi:hypothetical protein